MAQAPYLIPAEPVIFEEEIKKSRFMTYLAHTPGLDAAKAFVQEIKTRHADARHNCWAFVAGRPEDSMLWGFSDDGEPSGTAGKPILAQLSGSGVGEITAVVTRYYGGIRLGTGGLVKAYGGGVQQALAVLMTKEKVITSALSICCAYNQVPLLEAVMAEHGAEVVHADYGVDVRMTLQLDNRQVENLKVMLMNRSSGQIRIQDADEPS
ncbi:YigZ family protein [Photobacterium galatheae]|uniref:Elongation factor n=1 Tax=Photobacterium galatheae TaxID=1654360 RepID=A0A066RSH3_9GAMM|nr:YigZ family protein [Photobacterium galatheae]KDM92056.1 elongation factor [Photobacterium galatheae]MCM0151029.1 YigZ family protein [Photobacterium galatheae]